MLACQFLLLVCVVIFPREPRWGLYLSCFVNVVMARTYVPVLCMITAFYTFSDCRICMLYTLQSMLNMPRRINLLFLLRRMNLSHCLESIHMSYKDNANLFHHCRRIFISTISIDNPLLQSKFEHVKSSQEVQRVRKDIRHNVRRKKLKNKNNFPFIRKLLHQRVEGKEVSQEENFLPKHQRVKDLCQRAEYQTPCQQTGQVTHTSLTTCPSRDLQRIISHPSRLY